MFNWNPIKNIDYIIDYYQILEVPIEASFNNIKKQYKKLSKEYHPDKFQTSGKEIQELSAKKMELILESFKILQNFETREIYDAQLKYFQKEKPNLISVNGTPILDLSKESYHMDFLLSGEEKLSFQEVQEKKVAQLLNFNQTIFDMIEKTYLSNPLDEKIKEAYMQQLSTRKAYLDFQETFAWQEMGVINAESVKIQSAKEYLEALNNKIDEVSQKFESLVEARLLGTSKEQPLLIGTTQISSNSKEMALEVKNQITKNLKEKSAKLIKAAQNKQAFLEKIVKIRTYKKVSENLSSRNFRVYLYQKSTNAVLTGFVLNFIDEEPQDVELDGTFNGVDLSSISCPVTYYVLEFNPELEIIFQVMEFVNEVVSESL